MLESQTARYKEVVTGALTPAEMRSSRSASGLWMRAEEQMGTHSRPPGCGAGPLGRMPLRDCRRMRPCASCRALSPVDIKSPARPPARRRDWCCSGSSSSPSHRAHRMLQGSFPSQNLRRFAEVQGETVSVREYTNTHTHTHTHTHTYTDIHIYTHIYLHAAFGEQE